MEYRFVLPTGTTCWIAARGRVERDRNGKPLRLRGVSLDITKRKEAEARRQLLQAYRNLGHEILHILSEPGDFHDSMQLALKTIKTGAGLDAVAIRLQDREDYPYSARRVFPGILCARRTRY